MSNFEEKEGFFSNYWRKFTRVSAEEFYRDLFPLGTFEQRMGKMDEYPVTKKGNGIVVYTEGEKKHTRMVFDDHKEIFQLLDNECAFMSPVSYYGKNRTAKNARYLYALTFDLDDVGKEEIDNFWAFHIYQKHYPIPTYIVNSGGGVHLYYVFKEPIPMTPKNQKALKTLKYELTDRMWNEDTSKLMDKQFQGLNQGFRLVGSKTKNGERVTCWRTGDRVTVDYLAQHIHPMNKADKGINVRMWHSNIPLEEAKKKYPEWYEQRIKMGRQKMSWHNPKKLYDWWLRQAEDAKRHHRYWYLFCLAVYGVKCGIPKKQVRKDAFQLQDLLTKECPEDPVTDEDINAAMKAYKEELHSFPRAEIEKLSGIPFKANKRNGRSQEKHLQGARAIRDINNENWREGNGRPNKEKMVWDYLQKHPAAKKIEVIKATGLSPKTVYKYYDKCMEMVKI